MLDCGDTIRIARLNQDRSIYRDKVALLRLSDRGLSTLAPATVRIKKRFFALNGWRLRWRAFERKLCADVDVDGKDGTERGGGVAAASGTIAHR
jgi:hypothetical protein